MRFEFATASRILFGPGTVREVPAILAGMLPAAKTRALVVTGGSVERATPLLDALADAGVDCATFSVVGEPTTEAIQLGTERAAREQCETVIGFGGGSALDAGKAIAALRSNPGDPLDYLEVVGRGKAMVQPPVPYIAIPTTAGTGTEVTRNAVLASTEHKVKVSLRSPMMLPRLAVVDPELTHDLPPALTATTGLDALTQLVEPYVSIRAHPITDAVCRDGMRRAARSLRRACEERDAPAAREDMSLASLFGGLALANAGLGAVHGFAGPIGGMFPAPHGAVCATLLPHVMDVNLQAMRQRLPQAEALGRYDEIARILTDDPGATAADAVRWVEELCQALQIPPLGSYGLTTEQIPLLIERASVASSMRGNPIPLTPGELQEILTRAL